MKDLLFLNKTKGYIYGACLCVFLLSFNQFVSSCAIALWLLLSIISFEKVDINKRRLLILFPLLYLLYGISLFYSQNETFYIFGRKLSLIVFPLLFFLHRYNEHQRKMILRSFVYGLLVSGILCLIIAVFNSFHFENGEVYFNANVEEGRGFVESITYGGNYFFGNHFSVFHQTVYYAIYLTLGIAILLWESKLFSKNGKIALLLFFILLIFFISNKASYIVLFLIFSIKLSTSILNKRLRWISLFLFITILILFIFFNPRFSQSLRKMEAEGITVDKEARYDYKMRVLSWDAALSLIRERPILGYGVSNAQNELNKVYEKEGYIWPLKGDLNVHNQFLQLWIEIGILGVLLFCYILLLLLYEGVFAAKNGWLLSVFCIFFINACFESVFNRYSGISIITFTCCFIFSRTKK